MWTKTSFPPSLWIWNFEDWVGNDRCCLTHSVAGFRQAITSGNPTFARPRQLPPPTLSDTRQVAAVTWPRARWRANFDWAAALSRIHWD
jgi:hypothetical protein